MAIVRGCQVNLRNKQGQLISKGWKLMTTDEKLSQRMNLPCSCHPKTVHVPCEGSVTRETAYYTKEFAKRVCQCVHQGMNQEFYLLGIGTWSTQT